MSIYRRTIITLDDTQTGIDYMLFCVFEKLWPDMVSPVPLHQHILGKDFNGDGRYNVGVHIDEEDLNDEVVDNPLPYVCLKDKVKMLWGDMRRDPDLGIQGFLLKKNHYDIDSVTDLLPETQSVHQTWAWFDVQRKMYNYLGMHGVSLCKVGSFTKRYLNFNLGDNHLHIGCIYVVHYSPIKTIHVETVPMIPAVRCEIDWRMDAKREDVFVKVKEQVTGKKSIPNEFTEYVKSDSSFALVKMSSRPRRIDIDVVNSSGELLYFLKNVSFLGSVMTSVSKLPPKKLRYVVNSDNTVGLEHYLKQAILEKEAKIRREKMEFVFFDGNPVKQAENKQAAKECVERMLGKANENLIIADPYFAVDQFNEYILPLANRQGLHIIIINCKEQLEDVAKGLKKTFGDVEDELKSLVAAFNVNKDGNKVAIYCITGQGRLHDRFILTEIEGWQLGSSLSEFGKRACSIIKLMDSAQMQLNELLTGWCNDGAVSYKIE